MILQEFYIIYWGHRAMTEKKVQKIGKSKTLVTGMSHQIFHIPTRRRFFLESSCRDQSRVEPCGLWILSPFVHRVCIFHFIAQSNLFLLIFMGIHILCMYYLTLKKRMNQISHWKDEFLKTCVTSKGSKTMYIELYSCTS